MSSSIRTSLLLIAAIPLLASFSHARAAQERDVLEMGVPAQAVATPDETRIAADLKARRPFAGPAALAVKLGPDEVADWTTIRSAVRKGDVLEFRVTSLYEADTQGGTQREVDSIVSYRMDAGRWSLLGVRVAGAREVIPNRPDDAAQPC